MADAPKKPAPTVVRAEALKRFTVALFMKHGVPEADATLVADCLVWANLRGQDGHGVSRLPRYIHWLGTGEVNAKPDITVWSDAPALIALDADRAFGPIAMTKATGLAIEKARAAGVGIAMVRRTTHTAALGYYTQEIARAGLAGLAVAASIPNMAYFGAKASGVSTSPLSIAVPGGAHGPLVFDMGTAVVAVGKLRAMKRAGTPLPPGWALDAAGNPTTDPGEAALPMPIAGAKGSGLALMMECITSLALGNAILSPELEGGRPLTQRQNAFVMAIDLARLGSVDSYRAEVDRLVRNIKDLPPAEGGEVLVPGERGNRTMARRIAEGIPLPPAVMKDITELAEQAGVPKVETA